MSAGTEPNNWKRSKNRELVAEIVRILTEPDATVYLAIPMIPRAANGRHRQRAMPTSPRIVCQTDRRRQRAERHCVATDVPWAFSSTSGRHDQ